MNLVNGQRTSADECDFILEQLEQLLCHTLTKPRLETMTVVNACDALAKMADSPETESRLRALGVETRLLQTYRQQIKEMLLAPMLLKRLQHELGDLFLQPARISYAGGITATQTIAPLGVLFHITAGNVEGLPFISLLDGLLTGNINLVKLPREEGGITVFLLEELFKIEPRLREYVYVFDFSSKEEQAIKKLAATANAIVVWGGDEAVAAARQLAAPNTKIIEWGHKISFAYVTQGTSAKALEELAGHICQTNQLFCSSCQGIYLDTASLPEVQAFCERFLPILEKASEENPRSPEGAANLFADASATLQKYQTQLESPQTGRLLYNGRGCSLTACPDAKLEISMQYRNAWVKPLPSQQLLKLRPYKSYLQTAALLCAPEEYEGLSNKLLQTGLVKISGGWEISGYAPLEAHDGAFPLRLYTRVISVQNAQSTAIQ